MHCYVIITIFVYLEVTNVHENNACCLVCNQKNSVTIEFMDALKHTGYAGIHQVCQESKAFIYVHYH